MLFASFVEAQTLEDTDEMGFFDIQDGLGEESFFAIDDTENTEERDKTERDGIPAYSISGSIKQDFIYGISEPGDEFNRNQEGIEKIYSEFFLQAQNSLTKNSKIKFSGVITHAPSFCF